jgi:hypothetical protein
LDADVRHRVVAVALVEIRGYEMFKALVSGFRRQA